MRACAARARARYACHLSLAPVPTSSIDTLDESESESESEKLGTARGVDRGGKGGQKYANGDSIDELNARISQSAFDDGATARRHVQGVATAKQDSRPQPSKKVRQGFHMRCILVERSQVNVMDARLNDERVIFICGMIGEPAVEICNQQRVVEFSFLGVF